jgi:parallel beta-helix repeat protein
MMRAKRFARAPRRRMSVASPRRQAPAIVASVAAIVVLAVPGAMALDGDPAAASHISCGATITADTTLDSDLVDCPNNGIVIGADDITLDLNGHTISGDDEPFAACPENEPCDTGVLNDGRNDLIVKDGKITDFGLGVVLVETKRNRVRDVAAVENAFEGIVIFRSMRTHVQGGAASRNGVGESRPGIALVASDDNRITGNKLSGNGDLGLFMAAADRNLIRHNKTRGHPEGGMIIEGDRNEIVRNRSAQEGGGILITIVNRGGTAVGNVIRRNEVRDARAAGIAVDQAAERTLVKGNFVAGSGRSGIGVGSSSTTITNNRAVRNDRFGIEAVEGVTDGGGNRASGNGRARQCVNVRCR